MSLKRPFPPKNKRVSAGIFCRSEVPDYFVIGTIKLSPAMPQTLDHYDSGHNERRKMTSYISAGANRLTVSEM